ncbi:hypothetical protein [Tolypothrix bouteillei]|uniref:hypothetical protein n=1 Tax=Tolypothrix bouteillei TaxID=1246981 RepID=UPI0038B4FCD9
MKLSDSSATGLKRLRSPVGRVTNYTTSLTGNLVYNCCHFLEFSTFLPEWKDIVAVTAILNQS